MIRGAVAALALALAASASAAEYASVGTPGAILYDGPSPNATRLFVAPKGMPIELISVIRLWVKVRDAFGDVMWIERGDIAQQRTVVTTTVTIVKAHANDAAEMVFQADQGVVLQLLEPAPAPGWARVRHEDGSTGYVHARDVWGL